MISLISREGGLTADASILLRGLVAWLLKPTTLFAGLIVDRCTIHVRSWMFLDE